MRKSTLELTLKNDKKYLFETDSYIAEAVAEHHQDGGTFFSVQGRECFSVDFKNVLAVQVLPKEIAPTFSQSMSKSMPLVQSPTKFEDIPKALYKIECKCGAEYFARLFSNTTGCRCKQCGDRVDMDAYAPKRSGDNNEQATLITNKYRVPFVTDPEV